MIEPVQKKVRVVLDKVLEDNELALHIVEVNNDTVRALPNRAASSFRTGHDMVKLPPVPKDTPIEMSSIVSPFASILPQVIQKLLKSSTKLFPPQFKFEIDRKSAVFNINLLKENKFDLESLLHDVDRPRVTSYGSEFKSVPELQELLGKHPRWETLKSRL